MKFFIFSLIALATAGSFAGNGFERINFDFSSAQELDPEMQMDIKQYLVQNCQPTASEAKRVSIFTKSVRQDKIDQGVIDTYLTVGVSFIGRDNFESLGYEEIEVVRYSGTNPGVDHVHVNDSTKNSACR